MAHILVKDMLRICRDYIENCRYMDFVFTSLGCRFIALNDGMDTQQKSNEMLVIMKNVMNDLYARYTSNKIIKAAKQFTFKSGKYVGCYAPPWLQEKLSRQARFGNRHDNTPVVKHIFDMRLQGNDFRKIAV